MSEKVSRIYSNFRGVDFRGEEINLTRSPDVLNMWKDYKETESIRTRPGLALKNAMADKVYGIFFYNGAELVHAGTKLYKITDNGSEELLGDMNEATSSGFVYEGIFYIKDGKSYLRYDGTEIKPVEGFIPTTTIGRAPMGGGTKHQDVNMLSDYRRNTFLSDGGSFDYYLDAMNIDDDFLPQITYSYLQEESVPDEESGEETFGYTPVTRVLDASEYEVDYAKGKITFLNFAPDAPATDGQDNIEVLFKKQVVDDSGNEVYRKLILDCTLLQVFDNRVFFSGNPDHPNYVWHSSLDDPSYVSDLDYYKEGMDEAPVRGMVAGNNALWVFRAPSDANTTVFYHVPTIDEEYGKIYPSTHSSVTTGCIGRAINFNDDIVFFSERGMEGISGDIMTEQVLAHRSSLVDRKLTAEDGYKDMILAEWEGYLLVIIGSKVYLADSRAMFQNENHVEYEWFYWELDKEITCAGVQDGVLYLGAGDGVYTLTDTEKNLRSHWTTPKDKFNNPHKLKTTNKRGCVAEATGDIEVSAKLEDTDFEIVGEYKGVTDFFVSRIKRKKFKDIQLRFASNARFSLETVTLESYIGGYIKR
ncbi:MAG: hypothetical protein IJY94_05535 [Clostridia bacterium]|nr:hypothetical protein [Clostridia bacterium]